MKLSTFLLYQELFDSAFKDSLDDEGRKLRDKRYPRCAFSTFRYSTFMQLYQSKNDQALCNATGHNFHSFDNLLGLFAPWHYYYTYDNECERIRPKKLDNFGKPKGKPHNISACRCLALVLMRYRTKGSCARVLAPFFDQTASPLYK